MDHLFTPGKIGELTLENRLVHSATYEGMADEAGHVTKDLLKRYKALAKGRIGLIIPGYMFVHPFGKAMKWQTGIHADATVKGLTQLAETIHDQGGRVVFQISHAGRQTSPSLIGRNPMAPSSRGRDPVYFVKPRRMTEKEIAAVVEAFGEAAARAVLAGADGIQLHGCHGYLINEFLSPYHNLRKDAWGGSDEKRFRFARTLISAVRKEMPEGMPLLIKINAEDFTPKEGITIPLAVKHARWLADLHIDGIEVSCGSPVYSFMNMCRGDVPADDLMAGFPLWKKPAGWMVLKKMEGKFDLEEGYNVNAARKIKAEIADIPIFTVGGIRRVSQMEEIIRKGYADFISMSRPFIREPLLAKKIKEGKKNIASCISCNRCLAAAANKQPVRCYYRKDK